MGVNPHLRRRAETVLVRPGLSEKLTNVEIIAAFERSQQGKLAKKTISQYVSALQDVNDYLRSTAGGEVPLATWTREHVWEYVHNVEANYCRFFHVQSPVWSNSGAFCRKKQWKGLMPTEEALKTNCASCPLFQSSQESIAHRLHALNRFFKFLTRSGVAKANFVRNIVSEYYQDLRQEGRKEKRRNPTVEEMRKLVNETTHPRNRAFYASSAKWWFRPNEMGMLDRYTSFPDFEKGGDLVIVPDTKGVVDKRKGNRVSVIDSELRPILEHYFQWWERMVERKSDGKPAHTCLWLTSRGKPLRFNQNFYHVLFYADCIRLGLMTEADQEDPLRRWTGHCQRHFGEKLLMMNNCPDTWSKHFRGDVVKDARGQYFVPTPEQVREKYLEWVPKIGFTPLQNVTAAPVIYSQERERAVHRDIFQKGIERCLAWKRTSEPFRCQRVVRLDWSAREFETVAHVPHTYVASYVFAIRRSRPSERFEARPDSEAPHYGRNFHASKMIRMFREAQAWIDAT